MGAQAGQLLASEAERLIRALRPLGVELVGSAKWTQQQEALQRLNAQVGLPSPRFCPLPLVAAPQAPQDRLQAHFNAQTHSDEFVVEGLVSLDQLSTLVECLLEFEVCASAGQH